jgi:hypothetical protein
LHSSNVSICSIRIVIIITLAFGLARESDGNARYWFSWRSTEREEHGADTTVFAKAYDIPVRIVVDVSLRVVRSLDIEGSEFVVLHGFVASFAGHVEDSLNPRIPD